MNIADYSAAFIDENTVEGTVRNLGQWLAQRIM
jgi:hypothetical protein